MNQVSERKPNQEKVIAHPLEQEGVLKLERKVTQTLSSTPRVSISYYDSLSAPMRVLLYIPLTIQCHTFPTVLFTEGYHVFRQNFGFSSHKLAYSLVAAGLIYLESPEALVRNLFLGGVLIAISSPSFETRINNLCLYGMFLCTISKLYVNPWYDEKNEKVHAIWFNITDKTIPDTDYHTSFNTALWNFSKAVCVQVLTYVLNDIFSSLLNQAITFKRQYEFVKEWLSNDAAYGVKSGNQSSGAEEDNEKANLNPVQLFEDINNHNRILSLWNYRINSITDCYTATETANKDTTFKWATSLSPGQRKRLAFCNILLKLKTQDIEFLILDEPFKGIDSKMQAFMTKLLKNVIDDYNPNCTVLFANHEQNHGLNTHTLTFDEREYKLERC